MINVFPFFPDGYPRFSFGLKIFQIFSSIYNEKLIIIEYASHQDFTLAVPR